MVMTKFLQMYCQQNQIQSISVRFLPKKSNLLFYLLVSPLGSVESMNLVYLPICQSTNDQVRDYGVETVLWTSHQTQGRGQRGNVWESEPGQNLAMSYFTQNLHLTADEGFHLNIAVSLAVAESLEFLSEVRVKWPNDVLVRGKKIAGVLIETSLSGQKIMDAVIGIGININQMTKTPNRTSIKNETGKAFEIEKILHHILESLQNRLEHLRNRDFDRLKSDYYSNLYLFQEQATYQTHSGELFQGMILGITPEGKLAISDGKKVRKFGIKEVIFR
jgi:BirA family biotin operon repressor/biotin-[acetyl-CoA-carboxylase] ligase